MNLFNSEHQMQEWLSKQFRQNKSLADIINNIDDFKKQFESKKAKSRTLQKILTSFIHCLRSFDNNEVICENINIASNDGDILKPDFLLFAPESESVVIIELKNIKGPTREAGTEMSAYAAALRSHLPFIADGDLIHVIISNEWPTLLRYYIYNEIVWLNKMLICLEPVEVEGEVKLHIISANTISQSESEISKSSNQLGGYQICLYDEQIYKGGNYFRLQDYESSMHIALRAMSAKGNALKAHGFAFLWKHIWKVGLAPYNITVLNFAAFHNSSPIRPNSEIQKYAVRSKIQKIAVEHDPQGHGESLNSITERGKIFLKEFCQPKEEGFESWDSLRPRIFSNTDVIAFVGWGFFEELLFERLAEEPKHQESGYRYQVDDPLFALAVIDEIIF